MASGQGLVNRMPLPQVTWRPRQLQWHTSAHLTRGGNTHPSFITHHVAASQYCKLRGTACPNGLQTAYPEHSGPVTGFQQPNAGHGKGLTWDLMVKKKRRKAKEWANTVVACLPERHSTGTTPTANWEWRKDQKCNGRGQGTHPGQAAIQGEVDGVGAGVGEQDGVGTADVEGEPAVMGHPGHSKWAGQATGSSNGI